ncbi:MAG: DEAD/DEAH box helicase [Halanaerobiales bacterium]
MAVVDINEILNQEIISSIKKDIELSSKQEIFLVGIIDPEKGLVTDYNLLARGNSQMVPAIVSDLKPGTIIIHNHPSGDLRPSAADIRVASRVGNNGIGFAIVSNQVDDIYIVVEPKIPEEEVLLREKEIYKLFKPNGSLSRHLDKYEYRKQQLAVVKEVLDLFNNHKKTFVEAGTGTGKSFAYLIPALYWSHNNNQVVVVSTNTINLQEQLIEKDLVLLKKALPFSFKAVLVKGRWNYLCMRKLKNLEQRAKELYTDQHEKEIELIKVLNWIEETNTGSRSDLNFVIKTDLWDELASESDLCLRTNCPYFDSCFFMKARKEVYSADLLIVNHHLLISDAVLKYESGDTDIGILPEYKNLILDEAHNLSDAATRHLGNPFYLPQFHKYLQRLFHNKYSMIPRLRNKITQLNIFNKKDILNIIDQKIIPQIQKINDYSSDYYKQFELILPEEEKVIRLKEEIINKHEWQEIINFGDELISYMQKLGLYLNNLYENILNIRVDLLNKLEEILVELESNMTKCQVFIKRLDFNLKADDDDYVFWLERKKSVINQENAPLKISNMLSEMLWNSLDSLLLTSATLTVNNNFNFFKNILG